MKRALWWTICWPMSLVYLILVLLRAVPAVWLASMAVLDQALERYEYWTFDIGKDRFTNNPYRWSLWTTWKAGFEQAMSVRGDPRS